MIDIPHDDGSASKRKISSDVGETLEYLRTRFSEIFIKCPIVAICTSDPVTSEQMIHVCTSSDEDMAEDVYCAAIVLFATSVRWLKDNKNIEDHDITKVVFSAGVEKGIEYRSKGEIKLEDEAIALLFHAFKGIWETYLKLDIVPDTEIHITSRTVEEIATALDDTGIKGTGLRSDQIV